MAEESSSLQQEDGLQFPYAILFAHCFKQTGSTGCLSGLVQLSQNLLMLMREHIITAACPKTSHEADLVAQMDFVHPLCCFVRQVVAVLTVRGTCENTPLTCENTPLIVFPEADDDRCVFIVQQIFKNK